MCRAPRCEEVHYETSQKLQAKDFFVPSVGGFLVSFWDEVHPPGDDADVVQQMVAVSVLQWLISCSNMTGMINPDPNARNGSRETIQWNAHIWWEHMGTTIWFPDVNDVSSSSPDGFTHFIIPANSRSVRWTPWASPCGGAASGTWDGRLNYGRCRGFLGLNCWHPGNDALKCIGLSLISLI